jgi:hypothetical protein
MLDPNFPPEASLPTGGIVTPRGGVDCRAQAALAASPVVDLRELTVRRDGPSLLISGRVHCFYHKQLAQETVRPHAANLQLVNEVNVVG